MDLGGRGRNPVSEVVGPGQGGRLELDSGAILEVGPSDATIPLIVTIADATTALDTESSEVSSTSETVLVHVEPLDRSSRNPVPAQDEEPLLRFTLSVPNPRGSATHLAFSSSANSTPVYTTPGSRVGGALQTVFNWSAEAAETMYTRAISVFTPTCPYELKLVSTPSQILPGTMDLVLVHGFDQSQHDCGNNDFDRLVSMLVSHDGDRAYRIWKYLYPTNSSLYDASRELGRMISQNEMQNVTILAHSMGGAVAKHFLVNASGALDERILKVITLGSPLRGTPLAKNTIGLDLYRACLRMPFEEACRGVPMFPEGTIIPIQTVSLLLGSEGMRQLSPNSPFIADLLNRRDARLIPFTGDIDADSPGVNFKYRFLGSLLRVLVNGGAAPGFSSENDGMIPRNSATDGNLSNATILFNLDHTAIREADTALRRLRENLGRPGSSDEIRVSLEWNTKTDVDLYLLEPTREVIYFANRVSAAGGQLDRDSNGGCLIDGINRENITYSRRPPAGLFAVAVDLWSGCGVGSADYTVTIKQGGVARTLTGRVTTGSPRVIHDVFPHFMINVEIQDSSSPSALESQSFEQRLRTLRRVKVQNEW